MPLGKRQRETLEKYARSVKLPGDDPKTLYIRIHPWRKFTREQGGGSGHPITIQLDYGDDYPERAEWLSCCQDKYGAEAKGKEIARHLRDELGVPQESIKLQWA